MIADHIEISELSCVQQHNAEETRKNRSVVRDQWIELESQEMHRISYIRLNMSSFYATRYHTSESDQGLGSWNHFYYRS